MSNIMGAPQKNFLQLLENIPAFPESVHRILVLTSDIDCPPKELVEVVRHDPIFTLKILKVVNSPLFGLVQKITSIDQACVYVGVNTIRNIALSLASIGALPGKNKAGFSMSDFWLHSLAVATVSWKLGEALKVPLSEVGDYFAAGLLHDVGKVVFALHMPEEFRQALGSAAKNGHALYEAEREIIGTTHADMGAMLAKKWSLPENLTACIAGHHDSDVGKGSMIQGCVFAANQVGKRLKCGFAGNFKEEDLPQPLRDRFSMGVDEIIESMPDLDEEMEHAKVFMQF
ncbi:MAG: HDOD domain-containing protein [Thermodesulfobacteriota bacterium]|nr:HDOD domain-containing protein [Thermodesulfobacteriota bacterium]